MFCRCDVIVVNKSQHYSEIRDVKVPGPDLSNVVLILTRVDVNLSGLTETSSKEISLFMSSFPRQSSISGQLLDY